MAFPRLIAAVQRTFAANPGADMIQRQILAYQRLRGTTQIDWEGERETFKRMLKISFQHRHQRYSS